MDKNAGDEIIEWRGPEAESSKFLALKSQEEDKEWPEKEEVRWEKLKSVFKKWATASDALETKEMQATRTRLKTGMESREGLLQNQREFASLSIPPSFVAFFLF